MPNITCPLPLCVPDEDDLPQYLEYALAMGVKRMLFFAPIPGYFKDGSPTPSLSAYEEWSSLLEKRMAFFGSAGIEVGFWLGNSIGHGGPLSGSVTGSFSPLVGPTGKTVPGCFCTMDPAFQNYLADILAIMAKSKVPLMILDDDFRTHWHGENGLLGCFCDRHLEAFEQKLGSRLTRQELVQRAFNGKPSKERTLFLDLIAQGLYTIATTIETKVHAVNPETRLGLCTAMTLWSSEGLDMKTLLSKLAGPTRPFIRLIGAPYWSKEPMNTGWIIEYSRLQKSWLALTDVEVLMEGDTFPHTRFFCASSSLLAFTEGHLASGNQDFLLYPFQYSQRPNKEMRFVSDLIKNRAHFEALEKFIPASYKEVGFDVWQRPSFMDKMTLEKGWGDRQKAWPDEPVVLRYLARLGLPLTFFGEGPVFLCGQSAVAYTNEAIEKAIKRGIALDAGAARILLERDFDIGVTAIEPAPLPVFEHFPSHPLSGEFAGEKVFLLASGENIFYRVTMREGAEEGSTYTTQEGEKYPATVTYTRPDGARIFINCIDFYNARSAMQTLFNYAKQRQWANGFAFLAGRPLPCFVPGEPDVRVSCRMAREEGRAVFFLQNLRLDPLVNPVLEIDKRFRFDENSQLLVGSEDTPQSVNFLKLPDNASRKRGKLELTLPPMGSAAVSLRVLQ